MVKFLWIETSHLKSHAAKFGGLRYWCSGDKVFNLSHDRARLRSD